MKKTFLKSKLSSFKSSIETSTEKREKIAIFICLPIILVSILICSLILLSPSQTSATAPSQATDDVSASSESHTYSPNSPSSIEFQSLGNQTCAVSGIGNFRAKELKIPQISPNGEIVTAISSNAFFGCSTLESVYIPETISIIGENAFRNCESLMAIEVDMSNEYFSSVGGVLFSKDKNLLICYPQSKSSERYYLNPSVKYIGNYAFENIKNLSEILYAKDAENFNSISVGVGNELLNEIPILYDYKGQNNSK